MDRGGINIMQPKFATYANWVKLSGLSLTTTYDLLSRGQLRAVKVGKRVLIDVDHGLAWLAAQPRAELNSARKRAA